MSAPLAPGGPASIGYAQSAVAAQPDSTYVLAANALAESVPASACSAALTLTTGTAVLVAVHLAAGTLVSNVGFVSVAASVTPTHGWAALVDQSGTVLGVSADLTSTVIAATTWKTLPLVAPATTKYTGLHYVAVMVAAATEPSLAGSAAVEAAMSSGTGAPSPGIAVTSTAFATVPPTVGASMGSLTAAGAVVTPYVFVS
ncbi:MAG TPA: hypothetical protein VHX38_18755 [Pseudonocardiaceae bacterium]|jgi:hypothetical protein|nr:hypothetical protein [Pseudonocardiaceae bacterium]